MSTVTMTVEQYRQLKADAELGRLLREWHERAQAAEDSHAIAMAEDWRRIAARPTFAELQRRRAKPGPHARPFDAEAAQRWVATGHSDPQEGAAA